jgi:hypothetical protein
MPVTDGRALDACGAAIQKAVASLAASETKVLEKCVKSALKCVETKPEPAASVCRTAAGATCVTALQTWHDKTSPKVVAGLASKCGSDKVPPGELLGTSGLGFGSLDALCTAFGGGAGSITSLGECLARAVACRTETALATTMPRAGDFLAAVGASSGLCVSVAGGELGGLPNPKPDGAVAFTCQDAIAKAGTATFARTLATTQGCVATVRKCELTSAGPASCATDLAPKCATLFDKLTAVDNGVFDKDQALVAKGCASVPSASLLPTLGLGFAFDAQRCAALGVASVTDATDAATCVLREQRCAAADLLGLGAPPAAEVLAAVGQHPAGGDGLVCPAFSGPPSP